MPLLNQEINYLSAVSFETNFVRIPKTSFTCTSVSIPSLALGITNYASFFSDLPIEGDKINFEQLSISFIINEDFSTSIIENEKNFSKIIAYQNAFVGETEIQIINFEGVYDVSIIDIQGKLIFKLNNLFDNYFTLKSSSIKSGVYWVVLDNHPTIKPLKLVVQ